MSRSSQNLLAKANQHAVLGDQPDGCVVLNDDSAFDWHLGELGLLAQSQAGCLEMKNLSLVSLVVDSIGVDAPRALEVVHKLLAHGGPDLLEALQLAGLVETLLHSWCSLSVTRASSSSADSADSVVTPGSILWSISALEAQLKELEEPNPEQAILFERGDTVAKLLGEVKAESDFCIIIRGQNAVMHSDVTRAIQLEDKFYCLPSDAPISEFLDFIVHVVDSSKWLLEVPETLALQVIDLASLVHQKSPDTMIIVCILCDPFSGYSGLPHALLAIIDNDLAYAKADCAPILVVRVDDCDDIQHEVRHRSPEPGMRAVAFCRLSVTASSIACYMLQVTHCMVPAKASTRLARDFYA
jgi:hypothetical protein